MLEADLDVFEVLVQVHCVHEANAAGALTASEEKVKVGMMKYYIWIKRITGVVFIIAGSYLLWLYLEAEGYINL